MFWATRALHWRSQQAYPSLEGAAKFVKVCRAGDRSLQFLIQRQIPIKSESAACVDYVPALCSHCLSLLPIGWFSEILDWNWILRAQQSTRAKQRPSEAGFHTGGGKSWNWVRFSSQVLNNNLVPDCGRSNLRESKFSWGRGGGGHVPSRNARLRMCEHAFARSYHPATILFPPQRKTLYETLRSKGVSPMTVALPPWWYLLTSSRRALQYSSSEAPTAPPPQSILPARPVQHHPHEWSPSSPCSSWPSSAWVLPQRSPFDLDLPPQSKPRGSGYLGHAEENQGRKLGRKVKHNWHKSANLNTTYVLCYCMYTYVAWTFNVYLWSYS